MNVLVRPITGEDVHDYKSLRLEMIIGHPDKFIVDVEQYLQMSDEDWENDVLNFVKDDKKDRLLAFSDGEIVGMLGYLTISSPSNGQAIKIGSFYVRDEFQGRGVGTNLFNRLYEEIDSNLIDVLTLDVSKTNEVAIYWYKKLGFTICNEINELEWCMELLIDKNKH